MSGTKLIHDLDGPPLVFSFYFLDSRVWVGFRHFTKNTAENAGQTMASVELAESRRDAETTTNMAAVTSMAEAETETRDDVLLDDNTGDRVEQHLAPVDGGIAAWRLLWAAFMFEACLWGTPLAFS